MRKILVLFILGLATLSGSAWNNVGHRTIAELAWRQLSKEERKAASDLLKQHPHYKVFLTSDTPKNVDKNEWAFLTAAVWPDMVRPSKPGQPKKSESITKYDLYPHAIGYPFLKAGETNQALLENFYIAKPNAEMVLSNSLATLKNKKANAHDRAVSLCWVLHLFGDLHQPLHAANRVTVRNPGGESLGGDLIVLNQDSRRVTLHAFWDQLPGIDVSYQKISTLADTLQTTPELKVTALKEYKENKTIPAWIQEGFRISVNFAYDENRLQFVYDDDLDAGIIPESAIPKVTQEYFIEARKIAHQRLMLAAQRVADELKQIW